MKRQIQTHEALLLVRPLGGHNIEEWLQAHAVRADSWELVLQGPVVDATNLFAVTVSYTAAGADLSDIMRPYRTAKWKKLADVVAETSIRKESTE